MNDWIPGRRRFPSRREVVQIGVGAFVAALIPGALRRRSMVRRTVPAMGTFAELLVVGREPKEGHGAIDAAVEALTAVERRMSRFDPGSEISRINRDGLREAVPVSRDTAIVIEEALRWAGWSDGDFDPCLGRVIAVWDLERRQRPPAGTKLQALANRGWYRRVEVGTWRGADAVRYYDPDIQFDLGGIAKGYGVDRAAAAVRAKGIESALINVGGDLVAVGHSPSGDPWRVGIRSPDDPTRLSQVIDLSDAAVATSGDYAQGFTYRGRRYHHILDPATAAPRRSDRHSVSVVAPTCMVADAAATAVFGRPREGALELVSTVPGVEIVSGI